MPAFPPCPDPFPVDTADDWQDDERAPDSLGAPCRECGRPTLSTIRSLCACCEADQEGWEL